MVVHAGSVGRRRSADSSGRPVAILPGSCVSSKSGSSTAPTSIGCEPVVKVEVAVGRRRTWFGQRVPGRHALVHLGATVPERDWPEGVATIAGWARRLGRRARRGPRRRARPPVVRSRALDRHLAVGRRGASPPDRRGGGRTGRASGHPGPPGPADGGAGAPARIVDGADRAGLGHAAALDPGRRPADAGDLDLGNERKVDHDPPDHPDPAPRRASRRDDDLGRDPRRRAHGGSRRLDRSRRRARGPPSVRRGRRGPRDRAGRPGPPRDGLRVQRREHPHERQLRPPRPPGHPHAAGAGRGEGDGLPDHPPRWLGDPQRRRPLRPRRRAGAFGRGWRCSRSRGTVAAGPATPGPRRPCLPGPARTSSARPRATAGPRSRGIREIPITLNGLARHNVANALAAAGGARALGASIEDVRTGLLDFRPSAEESPGRLNIFRNGARVAIIDFAHNEAGVSALLDVAEGIAAGAGGRVTPITVIVGTAGDRPDDTLRGMGAIAASRAQRLVIKETLGYLRGRSRESVVGEMQAGAAGAGWTARDPRLRVGDGGAAGRAERGRSGRRRDLVPSRPGSSSCSATRTARGSLRCWPTSGSGPSSRPRTWPASRRGWRIARDG